MSSRSIIYVYLIFTYGRVNVYVHCLLCYDWGYACNLACDGLVDFVNRNFTMVLVILALIVGIAEFHQQLQEEHAEAEAERDRVYKRLYIRL